MSNIYYISSVAQICAALICVNIMAAPNAHWCVGIISLWTILIVLRIPRDIKRDNTCS